MIKTWEEAAYAAAEGLKPQWKVPPVRIGDDKHNDISRLRRIFAGETEGLAPAFQYARSLAELALSKLVSGSSNRDEHARLVLDNIVKLVAKKQHDYGHGNILAFGVKGVIVRLSDKVERHNNLVDRGVSAGLDESIEDTLIDIVGYAIILTMLENGTFELPLAADVKVEAKPDVFVVSTDDVRRIVREELHSYHFGRHPEATPIKPVLESTWARYAASAFGGR